MTNILEILKCAVAALALAGWLPLAAAAQTERLDQLFTDLAAAGETEWEPIEDAIWSEWSHSGSAAMDLLLERGRTALEAGDTTTAIEHLTALVDHAPDFAEGYNARATAYFQAGLYGPSIDDIRHTLALNPRHFGAMTGLALILEELGHSEDALFAYRQVQSIHPARPNIKEAIERLQAKLQGKSL